MKKTSSERVKAFEADFKRLLTKHGFKDYVPFDMNEGRPFSHASIGVADNHLDLVLFGCAHEMQCPDCEKEGCHENNPS